MRAHDQRRCRSLVVLAAMLVSACSSTPALPPALVRYHAVQGSGTFESPEFNRVVLKLNDIAVPEDTQVFRAAVDVRNQSAHTLVLERAEVETPAGRYPAVLDQRTVAELTVAPGQTKPVGFEVPLPWTSVGALGTMVRLNFVWRLDGARHRVAMTYERVM